MTPLLAEIEYRRIRNASAFNVEGGQRRNVNQHMREYSFSDGSILRIYRKGHASVATGPGDYRTVIVGLLRTNAFGR